MSYRVLARKWRPKTFAEVVGQNHVIQPLTNALINQQLHHAYLFYGTRGVGKTTIARIFAKCLNCESGITATPCGKCQSCQEIDNNNCIDLIEIDAASKTKVEDTRELLNNVPYAPTYHRFKIYLIDEVHMLSAHSFNALLKTLEEPPQHVKFLLATTDPQKLPVTILSRCLQFNLRTISVEQIVKHLTEILIAEKIQSSNTTTIALHKIAEAADGSIRDALSILDQALAYGNNTINEADIDNLLGKVSDIYAFNILHALANNDANTIFSTIKELSEKAINYYAVLEDLLSLLHAISVFQIVPTAYAGTYNNEKIKELSALFSPEDVQLYYQIALIGRRDLALTPNIKNGFEMIMLRMLAFRPVASNDKNIPLPNIQKSTASITKPNPTKSWEQILQQLDLPASTKALVSNCALVEMTDHNVILAMHTKHNPLLHKQHEERLSLAFNKLYGKPMQVIIKITNNTIDTPYEKSVKEQTEKQNNAIENFQKNANVQKLVETFGAKIIEGSITPLEEKTDDNT